MGREKRESVFLFCFPFSTPHENVRSIPKPLFPDYFLKGNDLIRLVRVSDWLVILTLQPHEPHKDK